MTNDQVADRFPQLWWYLHNVPIDDNLDIARDPQPIIGKVTPPNELNVPFADAYIARFRTLFHYMATEEMQNVPDAYNMMYFDETQTWLSSGDPRLSQYEIDYVKQTIDASSKKDRALGSLVLRHVRGFSHGPEAISNTFSPFMKDHQGGIPNNRGHGSVTGWWNFLQKDNSENPTNFELSAASSGL
jgi:hypothetical protein